MKNNPGKTERIRYDPRCFLFLLSVKPDAHRNYNKQSMPGNDGTIPVKACQKPPRGIYRGHQIQIDAVAMVLFSYIPEYHDPWQ